MAEFTGERIIPGEVDADLYNEHLARYAFAARLARARRVLDAGCGTGYGSAELARTAQAVTGVDVSREALAFAHQHYRLPNLHFAQASACALPHPEANFDLVVALEVIEHLEDWRAFLREVRRVLAPSGQFIVSTPNRLYYAETRELAGPNPFHAHEFDFAEFRGELSALFPHVSLFLENHAEGVVFQPVEPGDSAEARIDDAEVRPAEAHFFVAICAHHPHTGLPSFVYLPSAANVLRERERHIELLESELRVKNQWLEAAQSDLSKLNQQHQELLAMFRSQQAELEERNRWAEGLNRELEELREELAREQAAGRETAAGYEAKVAELEAANREKTAWALETERRLGAELEARGRELVECVERLDAAEKTVEERTHWGVELNGRLEAARERLALFEGSRWVRLGRRFGLGPPTP